MKFRHTKINTFITRKRPRKGFALIATLTLMMLLAMLAVALLATAASQNRIALQTMLQAEARQQALVGLDAAIGALQVELGADQRVTANSGILSQAGGTTPQHLLGVWNSWDGPIYGKSVSGHGNKITETYKEGRQQMFRRWLISSRDTNETRTLDAADKLCGRMPGRRVCLVGEGTLGKSRTAQHYVYADLLSMPTMGKNEACFAWWVGGENQKAKISVQDPKEATDVYEALHRTWNTPAPSFQGNRDLDFLPEDVEEPARLVTMASLPLLASTSQSAGTPYFFDVTTTSYSLPINVSMGGLKQDLCLLLNKPTLKGTDFEARSNQDCPLVENADVPRGTEVDMPIGSWQNLHAYYNCWPDGSAQDSKNFTARLLGSIDNAYTRMSGSIFEHQSLAYRDDPDTFKSAGDNVSFYDTRAMIEQGGTSAGYGRTPVMLAFLNNFGLTAEKDGTTKNAEGEEEDTYSLRMCFAPMFLWWNPYNVPMKVRGQQLWAQSVPYKTMCLETYSKGSKTDDEYGWSDYALAQQNAQDNSSPGFGQDYGEYFQNSLGDAKGDIVFQPGEVIFFSPGSARTQRNEGFTNPWIPGYHPRSVSGYRAHFYSKKTKSEVEQEDWYVALRMGQQKQGERFYYLNRKTDGHWFAPRRPECISVMCGYNGQDGTNMGDTSLGKRGQSPQRFLLGWYDPEVDQGMMKDGSDTGLVFVKKRDGMWKADGSQEDEEMPYYIAAVGIVAKSANPNVDKNVKPGDFRGKIWQHSSPAFWGSALARPDDQMRQYNPYQLATLPVSAGMNSAPMDSIGNNGYLGITGDGEMVSYASVMELPVHPPFSLAGFAGMRLQPGWYQSESSGTFPSHGALRRMQYQAGVPGVGIGNAFADPCLPATDVYTFFQTSLEHNEMKSNKGLFGDFFDHGLLINDAMWDRWFCSSVSDMPDKSGKKTAREVFEKFVTGKEDLPVARYKRVSTPYNNEALVNRIMEEDGWKYIAQYLMVDGGFNVNSISEEAWAAVLQGLAKRKLVAGKDGRLTLVEEGKSGGQVLFSRFMLSTTDKSIDGLGGYSAMQGSAEFRSSGLTSAWGEVRMLEPEGIKQLAKRIVEQVRKRGPFLSMSDFVNRRLEEGENGLKGALQAAIDATDINRDFDSATDAVVKNVPTGSLYKNPDAAKGSIHTAAPGYLIQSDVLASLGNILTVRDDTFTVRAYGCVRNPNKAVLAQAWCEAVVQRTMNYVDPTNNPEDSDYTPEGKKNNKGLSETNKVMGRQFRIVSFKWLDNWDI